MKGSSICFTTNVAQGHEGMEFGGQCSEWEICDEFWLKTVIDGGSYGLLYALATSNPPRWFQIIIIMDCITGEGLETQVNYGS